ncbi:MAG: hypothetical protein J0H96_11815 [Microbacterium ginsengisoli]|nr:hypothetical protein [Microbacterium ginsengisoli]
MSKSVPASVMCTLCGASGTVETNVRNPAAVAGKHLNCNGDAWDNEADRPTACECACHDAEVSS